MIFCSLIAEKKTHKKLHRGATGQKATVIKGLIVLKRCNKVFLTFILLLLNFRHIKVKNTQVFKAVCLK